MDSWKADDGKIMLFFFFFMTEFVPIGQELPEDYNYKFQSKSRSKQEGKNKHNNNLKTLVSK